MVGQGINRISKTCCLWNCTSNFVALSLYLPLDFVDSKNLFCFFFFDSNFFFLIPFFKVGWVEQHQRKKKVHGPPFIPFYLWPALVYKPTIVLQLFQQQQSLLLLLYSEPHAVLLRLVPLAYSSLDPGNPSHSPRAKDSDRT